MKSLHRISAVVLSLGLLTGCGGGGGGGGGAPLNDQAPTLVSVTFLGAGPNPVAGDKLRLTSSDAIALVAGAILSGADMQINGGTIVITGSATLISTYVLEVTLGAGVAMTTGTTMLSFGVDNDAVSDTSGKLAIAGTPRPLKKADAEVPTVTNVTLSGVVGALNGTGAAGGTLQVAGNGFSVDMTYQDTSSAVDPALNIVSVNVPVLVNGTSFVAGQNIVPHLTASASATAAVYSVPGGVVFPVGAVTITCFCLDTTGRVSAAKSFSFTTRTMTAALQPFEKTVNAKQVWFLDTSRDVESLSINLASSSARVMVTAGANSIPDLEDVFQILGLRVSNPIPNVSGSMNSNQVIMSQFQAKVLADLATFYAGANVSFTFASPGTFPAAQVVGYNSFTFSQMCIAGSATTTGATGVAGLAIFDPHNEFHENDCLIGFNGERLGVFLQTLANGAYLAPPTTTFASHFNLFAPTMIGGGTGIPIGSHPDNKDGTRLTNPALDTRAGKIATAIQNLARFTAVIVAHECGHSMGLVQNAPMPAGLYGNVLGAFPDSSAGHIKMPSAVFPGNSINIMTPAISYVGTLDPATRFNTLNLAYLREAAIYNN
jgi:hypothetical protein